MARSRSSKIAASLYTLRDFAETPTQAARTLKRVRAKTEREIKGERGGRIKGEFIKKKAPPP